MQRCVLLAVPALQSLAAYSIGASDAASSEEVEGQIRGRTEALAGLPSPPDAAVVQRLHDEYSECVYVGLPAALDHRSMGVFAVFVAIFSATFSPGCEVPLRFINALWTPVTSTSSKGVLLPGEACTVMLHKMPLLQEEMTSSLHRSTFLSALVSTKRKRAREMPDRQALLPSM